MHPQLSSGGSSDWLTHKPQICCAYFAHLNQYYRLWSIGGRGHFQCTSKGALSGEFQGALFRAFKAPLFQSGTTDVNLLLKHFPIARGYPWVLGWPASLRAGGRGPSGVWLLVNVFGWVLEVWCSSVPALHYASRPPRHSRPPKVKALALPVLQF